MLVTDVYEDPVWTSTSKVQSEKLERLIDPTDAQKIQEPGGKGEHKYSGINATEILFPTSTQGQRWLVWLVCCLRVLWCT